MLLNLSRTTVVRKFIFLGKHADEILKRETSSRTNVDEIEFDDMETFEHTKYKPLSITVMVEAKARKILGFEVSQMACNGPLAGKSKLKYGARRDARREARLILFSRIRDVIHEKTVLKSDMNPHYPPDVKKIFPGISHKRMKGRRGCVTGF